MTHEAVRDLVRAREAAADDLRRKCLVPGERSTGDTVRRSGLTLAGKRRARRALVEAAWTYRYPARVSETLRVRLCARYRRLSTAGKEPR
ncbi:transposase [Chelativorans sp.]|uniref:transposase n=1 Tax=Chelativorans sp. TaxID=2203393 RepID=UPI0035C6B4E1